MHDNRIIQEITDFINEHYNRYYGTFCSFSSIAKFQFEQRLWQAQRSANATRMELGSRSIELCKHEITIQLKNIKQVDQIWNEIKILTRSQPRAMPFLVFESFLLAVEQSLYPLVVINTPNYHQLWPTDKKSTEVLRIESPYSIDRLAEQVLQAPAFKAPYENYPRDISRLVDALEKIVTSETCASIELFPNLFYRNKHAYLVGLINDTQKIIPFTIPFVNGENGISMDSFLKTEKEITHIFEFTRSYFLVETQDPEGLIAFLKRIMPNKKTEQLIINLGYQEWGKHLIKDEFNEHLHLSPEKLYHAPGIRGMVMIVFTLPDYPMVFKTIKDIFPYSKDTTREEVVDKYKLIAKHDRVGRLADTQLFGHWRFPLSAFNDQLVTDLNKLAASCMSISDKDIIFTELFTERKMIPLNLFLETANQEDGAKAVIDYGHAIKELAMSNIFPGDLLVKNFGVTPDLRVVFYDYDEITLLTECRFRDLPQAKSEQQELDSEVWDVVLRNDIFPKEWEKFLFPEGHYRKLFRTHHADLYDISFWNHWKEFHLRGDFVDIQPY